MASASADQTASTANKKYASNSNNKRLTARQVTLTEFAEFYPVDGSVLPDALKLADVDNDGDFECVAGGFYGDVHIFKGIRSRHPRYRLQVDGTISSLCIGDIWGNGLNSLIVITAEGECTVFDLHPSQPPINTPKTQDTESKSPTPVPMSNSQHQDILSEEQKRMSTPSPTYSEEGRSAELDQHEHKCFECVPNVGVCLLSELYGGVDGAEQRNMLLVGTRSGSMDSTVSVYRFHLNPKSGEKKMEMVTSWEMPGDVHSLSTFTPTTTPITASTRTSRTKNTSSGGSNKALPNLSPLLRTTRGVLVGMVYGGAVVVDPVSGNVMPVPDVNIKARPLKTQMGPVATKLIPLQQQHKRFQPAQRSVSASSASSLRSRARIQLQRATSGGSFGSYGVQTEPNGSMEDVSGGRLSDDGSSAMSGEGELLSVQGEEQERDQRGNPEEGLENGAELEKNLEEQGTELVPGKDLEKEEEQQHKLKKNTEERDQEQELQLDGAQEHILQQDRDQNQELANAKNDVGDNTMPSKVAIHDTPVVSLGVLGSSPIVEENTDKQQKNQRQREPSLNSASDGDGDGEYEEEEGEINESATVVEGLAVSTDATNNDEGSHWLLREKRAIPTSTTDVHPHINANPYEQLDASDNYADETSASDMPRQQRGFESDNVSFLSDNVHFKADIVRSNLERSVTFETMGKQCEQWNEDSDEEEEEEVDIHMIQAYAPDDPRVRYVSSSTLAPTLVAGHAYVHSGIKHVEEGHFNENGEKGDILSGEKEDIFPDNKQGTFVTICSLEGHIRFVRLETKMVNNQDNNQVSTSRIRRRGSSAGRNGSMGPSGASSGAGVIGRRKGGSAAAALTETAKEPALVSCSGKLAFHQLLQEPTLAMHMADITCDGSREVVTCSWEGTTSIYDRQCNAVSFSFPGRVQAFHTGSFSSHPGRTSSCFAYVTPGGRVVLYTNVERGIKSVSSTTVIDTLRKRNKLETVLEVLDKCVDARIKNEFLMSMKGASKLAILEGWRAKLISEALHGSLKRRLVQLRATAAAVVTVNRE